MVVVVAQQGRGRGAPRGGAAQGRGGLGITLLGACCASLASPWLVGAGASDEVDKGDGHAAGMGRGGRKWRGQHKGPACYVASRAGHGSKEEEERKEKEGEKEKRKRKKRKRKREKEKGEKREREKEKEEASRRNSRRRSRARAAAFGRSATSTQNEERKQRDGMGIGTGVGTAGSSGKMSGHWMLRWKGF